MADYDLKNVQTFLIERETNTRRLLRGILARMGMDKIQEYATVAEATAAFATNMPDLIIVDCDPPEGEGFRFVQQLRHSHHATNPFACVVATTWQPTQPLMVRFTASGADDLIVKPFSTKQVQDRVVNLVEHRKDFVVTSDYIGPDRRKAPREGIQVPLFAVPNTLRLKAKGELDRATVGNAIAVSLAAINEQKVIRHGFQAAFLVQFAMPGLTADPPERMAVDHLLRTQSVVEDLLRRLPMDDVKPQAEIYARTILGEVERVRSDPSVPAEDTGALGRAAIGLAALAARRNDLATLEQEVSGAVAAYRNRLAQLAQAKATQAAPKEKEGAADSGPADKPDA